MKVTLLGTGGSAGVPMIGGADGSGDWGDCDPAEPRNRRTRSSIVVEGPDMQRLLVDTSPDMRGQLLDCRIPGVDAVLFTHAHADHITGIDDVRILNRIANRPLPAYATAETLAEMTRRFGYAFRPWEPPHFYRPVLEAKHIQHGDIFEAAGLTVRVFTQNHGRVETLGLRIGDFGYSTDVVELGDDAMAVLGGLDTWVVDCFLRKGPHWTHADLDTVLGWVKRLQPRRTVLTHMGTEMDWAWMQATLPLGVEAGHDGMVLDISRNVPA
jgi:phosphoribosyl 1,2-cyclic phosphate phosphodiesterase